MKMAESSPNTLRAISSLPTVFFFFFKRLVLQTRKTQGLFGKGLSTLTKIPAFLNCFTNKCLFIKVTLAQENSDHDRLAAYSDFNADASI